MNLSNITNRIMGRLRKYSPVKYPLVTSGHWIDQADAPEKIEKLQTSDLVREGLKSIYQNGFCILPQVLSPKDCDALIESFKKYCRDNPESNKYRDQHGLHERLANFQLVSKEAQALFTHPVVSEILSLLLETNPKLVGSLFFEKSTQQDFHRDTPAFFTNPLNHFFGVWWALEDIGSTQGPLRYLAKSHRLKGDAEMRLKFSESEGYQDELQKLAKEEGMETVQFHARKGDVFIWHPQLVHGGSPQTDPKRSRYSIVYHWTKSECQLYSVVDFFSGKTSFPRESTVYKNLAGVRMVDHGDPKYFHNRKEGNFDEFK